MTPLFLLSLPRSGSTLLQRILASHAKISSAAEPWLLLPLLYGLKSEGTYSEYHSDTCQKAISEFWGELPGGQAEYKQEIAQTVRRLYERAAPDGSTFFLDKTPRYHLIIEDILEAFPDAKFVILWRNPLAIAASMIDSFGNGRWNLHRFGIDLYRGLDNLCQAARLHSDRFHIVQYESLLDDATGTCRDLFSYLGLEGYDHVLEEFQNIDFKGSMGDKTGVVAYDSVSQLPPDKWKTTLSNPLRKAWADRYLQWIGAERLDLMGYDLEDLRSEVAAIPFGTSHIGSDIVRMTYGKIDALFDLNIVRRKLKLKRSGAMVFPLR